MGLGSGPHVHAQNYPPGPVKIIIPFSPGGPTDTIGRLLAQRLQEIWGQPVIVDFKPGAGSTIGVDYVAKSKPDGLTVGMINASFAVNPSLRKSLPYDTVNDIAPITQVAGLQVAIAVRPDAPFTTLPEFIAYAKKNPEKISFGTPGTGSTPHMAAELLKSRAGISMVHVPFKGSAPAHVELMGGRLDLVIDPLSSLAPHVAAGRMKILATMGQRRVSGYDYPIVAETVPGVHAVALLGFIAPRATPRPVIHKIQSDIASILKEDAVRKRIEEQGMEVVGSTPEQFETFVRSEIQRWGEVVKAAGIEAE